MKEGGLTALRFFKQFECGIPMRSLYYRIEVTREVLPASFFIEEVNKFLELLFLDEDECIFFYRRVSFISQLFYAFMHYVL